MRLTNEIRSQREVAAFKARKRPHKHYFAYMTFAKVNDNGAGGTYQPRITTFMGDVLATVMTIRFRTARSGWMTNQRAHFGRVVLTVGSIGVRTTVAACSAGCI